MSDLLILLGLAGVLVALWGLIRGRVGWARLSTRKAAGGAMAASFVAMTVGGALADPATQAPEAAEPASEAAVATPPVETPTSSPTPVPTSQSVQPPRPHGVPGRAQAGVVERVVDGDTLWVRIDEPGGPLAAAATHQIRVLEIDSPETKHPQRGIECWGSEATAFANRTLPIGFTVYLLADEEETDRYGRFLRYVWTNSGRFYNEHAVRQGFARAVLYEPNDAYIDLMRAAEAEARAANRGMWGPPCDYDASPPPGPVPGLASAPPKPAAPPRRAPKPTPKPPGPAGGCDPNYRGACVPTYPPHVDCGDIAAQDFQSVGPDPHGLDGDNDGVACES